MTFLAKTAVAAALVFVCFAAAPTPSQAETAETIETPGQEALLMDMETGAVMLAKNADQPMPPASMSKMMTVYMVFERLKDGRLTMDTMFPVSENAWRKGGAASGGSTMFLEPGSKVALGDLVRGIIVQSGNDACIVVAEGISGSEEAFAAEMTKRGRELGLKHTTFRNATGWPDPEHMTTATDLATLAELTIRNFPELYELYAETTFAYNGIKQQNRNPLLYKNIGADGLKTGHTEDSGFGLTASAKQDGRRLILVVNGLGSMKERISESERLMAWGFRAFDNYDLFAAGTPVSEAEVWLGQEITVPLVIANDLTVTLRRDARPDMQVAVSYDGPIPAPITEGDRLAILAVSAPGMDPVEVPLVAGKSVDELGMFGRLTAAASEFISRQLR